VDLLCRLLGTIVAWMYLIGGFQDGKGTSAWVIEGNNSNNRILGSNFTPGTGYQQNSYHSELSGLYGISVMLITLCKLHQIQSGSITIACDNISALNNAMQHDHLPSLSQAEYDFIYVIKQKLQMLPISYSVKHVKGHQDNGGPTKRLDRWSLLNIEMDALAKSILEQWQECPSSQLIDGEPWPVMQDGVKLVKDIDRNLYKIVHAPAVLQYWTAKNKFPSHMKDSIHWEALETAMKETPFL
jgi:hypothetical protein